MSATVSQAQCMQCDSDNCYSEDFRDDETGHIVVCEDCGYSDVFRYNTDSGKIIEDYQGYKHYYTQEKLQAKDELEQQLFADDLEKHEQDVNLFNLNKENK